MRWPAGADFEILDQRALPGREVFIPLRSATGTAHAIRDLAVRGAPAIGCTAAFGIAVEALNAVDVPPGMFAARLEAAFVELAASRPTAINLFWALDRMRAAWKTGNFVVSRTVPAKSRCGAER
mgnify:CR=1 FL=1